MSDSSAIRLSGVTKSYGPVQALKGVDLNFGTGGIVGLVGPNGAGKTTLFSVMCGFLRADAGTVTIAGASVTPSTPPVAGTVAILPQDARFLPHVPVLDHLVYYGRLSGMDKATARVRASEVLEMVGLPGISARGPDALSHGQRKRVGIAQAFMGKPDLVILDEPTAGLDPHASREIHAVLRRMRGAQTVIVSSHDLDEIQDLCSQVAILHQGRIVRNERIEQLLSSAGEVTFRMAEPPAQSLVEMIAAEHAWVASAAWDTDVGKLRVTFDAAGKASDEASRDLVAFLVGQGAAFLEMQVGQSLEDRFIEETKRR